MPAEPKNTYIINYLNLEILDMIIGTLRECGEVHVELMGGRQAIPSLATLAVQAVLQTK